MLNRVAILAALLFPAAALAQGSASKCAADPKFNGCYVLATSPVRTNVLWGASGDATRNFSIAQVLQQMIAADVTTALGFTPVSPAQAAAAAPVQSVAGLTGAVSPTSLQSALGLNSAAYQPAATFYAATNPSGFITAATAPVQSVVGLTGSPTAAQVQTALGLGTAAYQPSTAFYATTNPTGYTTLAQVSGTGFNARSRTGAQCFASGQFSAAGDAQTCTYVLRATSNSTGSVRLTTDGTAANGSNCINLAANTGISLRIDLVAVDTTNTVNIAHAKWDNLYLNRQAAASTTGLAGTGAAVAEGAGTMGGASYGVSADTGNACFALFATAPNTNITHWVARVTTVEVQ